MSFLQQIAESSLTATIALVLFHFLWQAALVTLGVWFVARKLPLRSAATRYNLYAGAMIVFMLLPVCTFAYFWKNHESVTGSTAHSHAVLSVFAPAEHATEFSWNSDTAVALVVLCWAVGALLFLGRLSVQLGKVQHLRTFGLTPVDARIYEYLTDLCSQMGIRRKVRIMKSNLVDVPTVMGCLRPLILLPASCLTGLSPLQIQALLAHELAHIRRFDYLMNVLQSVVEALFFFHPAVWWISKQLRIEREHCCDDEAVHACGDVLTYARALVEMENLREAVPQLVVAANGGSLLQRVQRLVHVQTNSMHRSHKVLAPSVAALLLVSLAPISLLAQEPEKENRCSCGQTTASKKTTKSSRVFRSDDGQVIYLSDIAGDVVDLALEDSEGPVKWKAMRRDLGKGEFDRTAPDTNLERFALARFVDGTELVVDFEDVAQIGDLAIDGGAFVELALGDTVDFTEEADAKEEPQEPAEEKPHVYQLKIDGSDYTFEVDTTTPLKEPYVITHGDSSYLLKYGDQDSDDESGKEITGYVLRLDPRISKDGKYLTLDTLLTEEFDGKETVRIRKGKVKSKEKNKVHKHSDFWKHQAGTKLRVRLEGDLDLWLEGDDPLTSGKVKELQGEWKEMPFDPRHGSVAVWTTEPPAVLDGTKMYGVLVHPFDSDCQEVDATEWNVEVDSRLLNAPQWNEIEVDARMQPGKFRISAPKSIRISPDVRMNSVFPFDHEEQNSKKVRVRKVNEKGLIEL